MFQQENSSWQKRLPLIVSLAVAGGMLIGLQLPRYGALVRWTERGDISHVNSLEEIIQYVQARYVDSVSAEQLRTHAFSHMLSQLDPHSVYIPAAELAQVEDDMSGDFEGIGIEFLVVEDTIQVMTALSGGPAQTAGILSGDRIVTINDTIVAGVQVDNAAIFKKLRGPKGSTVRVGVRRGWEKTARTFDLVRDVIPMKSVETAYMLDAQTGYFKINRFSAQTYREFMEALTPLAEKQGLKHVILDLRGNPGGYLNEAVDLLSQFFPEGKLLVYTEGRTEPRRDYKSNGRAAFDIRQVAILIDEGSASASEIVAGAIQDHDRGWVVGRRSFGKGLVQEQYDLSDGGALRLTVSRYYTPSGRSIQRPYKLVKDYEAEAERRFAQGELADGQRHDAGADSTKYYTGMGRVVYAKGGISPDVFVPLDTALLARGFSNLLNLVTPFAAQWLDSHDRAALPNTLPDFMRQFDPAAQMNAAFSTYAAQHGHQVIARFQGEINRRLKAQVARLLFQDEGFYRVVNADDPVVAKALHLVTTGVPVAKR